MTIKVHGNAGSPFAGLVLIILWEKDAEFELLPVDVDGGANRKPAHLALQPFGKIPVIVDGDYVLFESRAIARYIADRFASQGNDIYPTDLKTRSLVNQWMDVEAHNFSKHFVSLAQERVIARRKGLSGDEAKVQESVNKLEETLDVYDAQLSKHKYLAGDTVTIADLGHVIAFHWLLLLSPEIAESVKTRKHLQSWWGDVSSRPSVKKYFELAPIALLASNPTRQ